MAHKLRTLVQACSFCVLSLSGLAGCEKPSAAQAASASPAASTAPGPVLGRLVEIVASSEGYSPAKIEAKAGEQLTLRVTRKTKSECLSEIVIPSLGVRKALPIDVPVDIPVKVDQPGEIKFSCGMGMVSGKINVS